MIEAVKRTIGFDTYWGDQNGKICRRPAPAGLDQVVGEDPRGLLCRSDPRRRRNALGSEWLSRLGHEWRDSGEGQADEGATGAGSPDDAATVRPP